MPATLKDAARHARVSPRTISRVVNRQGEISETTHAHVQAAIEELGYRPNTLARSLVNQRSNTVARVASRIESFGPSRTTLVVEQQADRSGYSLFLELLPHPEELPLTQLLDDQIARRVEGNIWAIPEIGENRCWFSAAQVKQLPPINFISMAPRADLSTVATDNCAGA